MKGRHRFRHLAVGVYLRFFSFCQESLQKELDEAKSATSSMEEKLQEQKQLTEAQQEAKVALEAKLQEMQGSKSDVEAWANKGS